ncbi:GNAT family N-acetyltransferase [Corallococcus sp. EGB]|uniref:GNAT family N-acetyltransferase n=1 Tax=Corallococcus sp. EGB TaxID=1521117 RepID=UPI001CBDCE43|nr:GNAT family N-acetyltransferase [Corallococcus sp. EGB]
MIEVRTFEGDASEASWFLNRVWQATYGKTAPLPVWDKRLCDWRLFRNGQAPRDYLLAAYAGRQLVGTLFAEPARLRLGRVEVDGSYGPRATVTNSHRGQGIGAKLAQELLRRHQDRAAQLALGFTTAAPRPQGFWRRAWNTRLFGGLALWMYAFDARALSRWSFTDSERRLFSLARPFLRHRFRDADREGIRLYQPTDLGRCMTLVHDMLRPVTLGYTYTAEQLAAQLQYRDVPRTFVLEQDGEVRGLVSSHSLLMTGMGELTTEVVDLMAFDASVSDEDRQRLLQVAMQDMEHRGVACAGMLRGPALSGCLLLRSGWVPLPRRARLACLMPTCDLDLPAAPCVFTHLR